MKLIRTIRHRFSHTGFTILELLVVIAVISILASVVLAATAKSREKAKIARAKQDLMALNAAINLLQNDTGRWPNGCRAGVQSNFETAIDGGIDSVYAGILAKPTATVNPTTSCFWTQAQVDAWKGPYATAGIDPWNTPYFFDPDYCPGNNTWFPTILSKGPNKIQNYGLACNVPSIKEMAVPDDIVYYLQK